MMMRGGRNPVHPSADAIERKALMQVDQPGNSIHLSASILSFRQKNEQQERT